MFPWLWLYAPQFLVHYPFSGAVTQDIQTDWFSQYVKGKAGDADTERSAVAVASYGKQLGLITELLLAVAAQQQSLPEAAQTSRERLQAIQDAIAALKKATA